MKNDFVRLATIDDLSEADIIKTKLESEGIECYITDETIVGLARVHVFCQTGRCKKSFRINREIKGVPLGTALFHYYFFQIYPAAAYKFYYEAENKSGNYRCNYVSSDFSFFFTPG